MTYEQTLYWIVVSYAMVGIGKVILSIPSIIPATWAVSRLRYGKGSTEVAWDWAVCALFTVSAWSMLAWPWLLWEEREEFFLTYTKRATIREVLLTMDELEG